MPEQTMMVWIEDGKGKITRGQADSVTAEGLCVRLDESPSFGREDEVAVRICFDRGAPIVASTACVAWLRAGEGAVECGLRWTESAEQRAALDAWLARAA
jgi:hypothetical protein